MFRHQDEQGSLRKAMPYWCGDCRKNFSVRTNSIMESTGIGYQKWAIGLFLYVTNLKGVSSMKLHRDLNISQKSAWFMLYGLREAFSQSRNMFDGIVEVDETHIGGLERNKHKNRKLKGGQGGANMSIVIGMKERETKKVKAQVIEDRSRRTLHGFIEDNVETGPMVNTDDWKGYRNLAWHNHEFVRHSVGEYV